MIRAVVVAAVTLGAGVGAYVAADPVLDLVLGARDAGESDDARSTEPTSVTVARARTERVRDGTEAVGTTRALRSVEVRPDGDGRIVEVAFVTGERLERGALMVQLDAGAEEAALRRTRAGLAAAQGDLTRAHTLAERDVTSEAALENERAAYLVAEAAVADAENALSERRILAPFAGTAGLNDLDVGQWVEAGERLTTLDDLTAVEIAFSLPEPYYARVRPGRPVEATTAAYPGRVFAGTVSEVGTRVDPSTRAFPVRARIANDDRALVGGLFMDVTVTFAARRSVVVPEVAVVREGESTALYVVEDGSARRIEVTVGRQLGDDVEITAGLEAGREVIVEGLQSVEDGAPVSVVRTATAEPA